MARNFVGCREKVFNRGRPPVAFLNELVDWGVSAPAEIFARNNRTDIYSVVSDELGPWANDLERRAAMLEVLRVLAGFESSWKWNAGPDTTNPDSNTACTEEAGILQCSGDSMNFDASLKQLLRTVSGRIAFRSKGRRNQITSLLSSTVPGCFDSRWLITDRSGTIILTPSCDRMPWRNCWASSRAKCTLRQEKHRLRARQTSGRGPGRAVRAPPVGPRLRLRPNRRGRLRPNPRGRPRPNPRGRPRLGVRPRGRREGHHGRRRANCPPSALMRKIGWVEEGRISGSS